MSELRGRYKPKEENIKKLNEFLERLSKIESNKEQKQTNNNGEFRG